MNLKRCENGHFYDTDKFASCPHCSGEGVKPDPSMAVTEAYGISNDVTIPNTTAYDNRNVKEVSNMSETTSSTVSLKSFVQQSQIDTVTVDDEEKTVRYSAGTTKIEPVTGWLVAVSGDMAGESYILKSGRNFVGRGSDMDVVLAGDKSVSRDKHAIILFEPRKREFLVQPGESRELFYLNDEVVLNTTSLKPYDKLLIGETELYFVPFCCDRFGWEDIKKDDK